MNASPLPKISGMTTLWGFRLTTGRNSVGVGAKALFLNGLLFGAVFLLGQWAMLQFAGLLTPHLSASDAQNLLAFRQFPHGNPLVILLYILLVRFTPLAGLHAAEHMVINAFDDNQPLTEGLLARQSPVNPRCGSIIFMIVFGVGLALYLTRAFSIFWGPLPALLLSTAGLFAFFRWFTPINHWAQKALFTTQPTPDQLRYALRLAKALRNKIGNRPQKPEVQGARLLRSPATYCGLFGPLLAAVLAVSLHWVGP